MRPLAVPSSAAGQPWPEATQPPWDLDRSARSCKCRSIEAGDVGTSKRQGVGSASRVEPARARPTPLTPLPMYAGVLPARNSSRRGRVRVTAGAATRSPRDAHDRTSPRRSAAAKVCQWLIPGLTGAIATQRASVRVRRRGHDTEPLASSLGPGSDHVRLAGRVIEREWRSRGRDPPRNGCARQGVPHSPSYGTPCQRRCARNARRCHPPARRRRAVELPNRRSRHPRRSVLRTSVHRRCPAGGGAGAFPRMNLHQPSISPVGRAHALEATEVWGRYPGDPFGPWLKHAGPRGRHAVAPHARARGNPRGVPPPSSQVQSAQ